MGGSITLPRIKSLRQTSHSHTTVAAGKYWPPRGWGARDDSPIEALMMLGCFICLLTVNGPG